MSRIAKIAAALLLATAICAAGNCAVFASADTTSSQGAQTTVASKNDDDVPEVTVSSNAQETLGTVGFSDHNAKSIAVGSATTLYLTIKDMGYNFSTAFESSDTSVATVKYVDPRAVRVVGLKNGTVTITATVDSTKGVKRAKYVLVVGDDVSSAAQTVESDTQSDSQGGIIEEYENNNDLDLFSSTADPMLTEYANARTKTNATSLLLGLIAWIFIISGAVYIFSVVISLHTPKLDSSPGGRRRYSMGGSGSLRSGNRLLPDKYYRRLKEY